jgi:hypothetical protein
MLNFLFWNVDCQRCLLGQLVREHAVDVLLLAENRAAPEEIVADIEGVSGSRFHHDPMCRGGIAMFTRFPRSYIEPELDEQGFSVRRLRLSPQEILLVLLHFPSKLNRTDDDQAALCPEYAREIREIEEKVGHRRTVLVGDLNMNPFERGVVQATGFHAVMSRKVAAKGERTVDERTYPFFYSPMWNLFGDGRDAPPGTFYRDKGDVLSFFWHLYDQVLVRPEVVSRFLLDELRILTRCGEESLVDEEGQPCVSDHLPLFFRLDLDVPGDSHGHHPS